MILSENFPDINLIFIFLRSFRIFFMDFAAFPVFLPKFMYNVCIMKSHAIIPVFISHRGCPNDCVFCNQKRITARSGDVTVEDARRTIEEHLSTIENMNLETVELAFFGGSFTGIPLEEQSAFLALAREYKAAGKIDKIHLSTRPDYINPEILDNLARYGADVIELGVQSFDEEVLRLSGRGHNADVVYKSSALIKEYGFTLGIQLMAGLPGDTLEKCIFSARETVKLAPEISRIYPTVVIKDTALHDMMLAGLYTPLSEEEAINRSKAMYEILDDAGINIIRVGLKSSDIMASETAFHPAFRQLVEGRIARERLEAQLERLLDATAPASSSKNTSEIAGSMTEVLFISNERCYNNLSGHKACNRKYFAEKYPQIRFRFGKDAGLKDSEYLVRLCSRGACAGQK